MSAKQQGTGILETVREMAPAVTGNPVAVWHAARVGTERLADELPDAMGLDHLKGFMRRHPVVTTCAALAIGYYLVGGALFGRRGRRH